MPLEAPRRRHHAADVVELRRFNLKNGVRITAMIALKQGLVIERIDLTDAAVHVKEDDILGARAMMCATICRLRLSACAQRRKCDRAEAAGARAQHVAASPWRDW